MDVGIPCITSIRLNLKTNLSTPFRWYEMGKMVTHKIATSQELKQKALFRSTKYDIKNEEENNHF